MSRFEEADLSRIRPQPVEGRKSKVAVGDFARPVTPEMGALLDALPSILAGTDLREAVAAVAKAAGAGRPVVAMIGGHVIKTGCAPLLIQLMDAKAVTAVAMNGAAAIHDYEAARFGRTSEDVEASLGAGTFGMADETSREMNGITVEASREGKGLGEALGEALERDRAPHRDRSVLAACHRRGLPATVHVALGTDILHQHRSADGAAIGDTSLRDFRILAGVLRDFSGGVALNFGSAVVLPEVFLKAFSIAANLGKAPTGITTVNFDFLRHYRPRVNVVQRPTAGGRGRGIELTGHHEILIPLFTAGVLRALGPESAGDAAS
jgi:hypothetical protein